MIRDIVHLNLNVTDIRRSIAFYEAIGFQVMHVFGDREGAEVDEGMAFGGGRCRGAVLTLGEHPRCWTKLELIEWVEPKVEGAPPRGPHTAGISRIALRTKNLPPRNLPQKNRPWKSPNPSRKNLLLNLKSQLSPRRLRSPFSKNQTP